MPDNPFAGLFGPPAAPAARANPFSGLFGSDPLDEEEERRKAEARRLREEREREMLAMGARPTADGYANIFAGGTKRFAAALDLIGRSDLKEHPDATKPIQMYAPEFAEEVEGSWVGWLVQRSKREAVAETQAIGLLGGAILTTEDLISDPHYRGRGVWDTIDHPATGPIEYAGRQLILSETPRQSPRRAPLLGEHSAEVFGALGCSEADLERLRAEHVI